MLPPSRILRALALPALLLLGTSSQLHAWTPKQAPIMTRWAKDVDPAHPLPDYPRPQMVRADWLNLNGVWQLKRGGAAGEGAPTGQKLPDEILVPFPVESALSGVMEHSDRLWYRRTFTVPDGWKKKRVLLHFGAVDYESEVFVNGQSLGVHTGGYLPFSYDITRALKKDGGEQELIVRVYDPTDDYGQPRGKQSLHPGGIMYTPCTGIWQTVWLEPVPEFAAIESLKIVPDVDGKALKLTVNTSVPADARARISVKIMDTADARGAAAEGEPNKELVIPLPDAKLWSPEHPFLYDFTVSLRYPGFYDGAQYLGERSDTVTSYFGMRKIALGDVDGVKKMLLNDQFVFQVGPLDQGFWPDGIYTAPTDAAMKADIQAMKDYGFNMVRKHIKVEPARWYYYCDKLGLVVWQDMPSANSYIDDHKYRVPPVDKQAYETQLAGMVQALGNVPSIILWDIYNESQGQFDTERLVAKVKAMDPDAARQRSQRRLALQVRRHPRHPQLPAARLPAADARSGDCLRRVRRHWLQGSRPHVA